MNVSRINYAPNFKGYFKYTTDTKTVVVDASYIKYIKPMYGRTGVIIDREEKIDGKTNCFTDYVEFSEAGKPAYSKFLEAYKKALEAPQDITVTYPLTDE